jgi:hypothetical protein
MEALATPQDTIEARLEEHRLRRAGALPGDDTRALDAEIARLERALEAMWRR